MNVYSYAGDNPINFLDQRGLQETKQEQSGLTTLVVNGVEMPLKQGMQQVLESYTGPRPRMETRTEEPPVEMPDLGSVLINTLSLGLFDMLSLPFMGGPEQAAEIARIREKLRPIKYSPSERATGVAGELGFGLLIDILTAKMPSPGTLPRVASRAAPALSAAHEIVELGGGLVKLSGGVPIQLRGPKVGPAFRTFEEAFEAAAGDETHIMEVILRENGKEIANWWEISETGLGKLGDTEQKFLSRVAPRPGVEVELRGWAQPCNLPGGCHLALDQATIETGADIMYRRLSPNEGITWYLGFEGWIEP